MTALQIEPATAEDTPAIARIHVLAWQRAYRDLLPHEHLQALSVDRHEAMWRDAVARGTPQLLVARRGVDVVGWLALGASRDADAGTDTAEVWALYVAPDHWGGGVGRRLWERAKSRCLEQGRRRATLWVLADNVRARRFYEAMGCAAQPHTATTFERAGRSVPELRYAIELGGIEPV